MPGKSVYFIITDSSSKCGLLPELFTVYTSVFYIVHISCSSFSSSAWGFFVNSSHLVTLPLHINFSIAHCERNITEFKFGDLFVVTGKGSCHMRNPLWRVEWKQVHSDVLLLPLHAMLGAGTKCCKQFFMSKSCLNCPWMVHFNSTLSKINLK